MNMILLMLSFFVLERSVETHCQQAPQQNPPHPYNIGMGATLVALGGNAATGDIVDQRTEAIVNAANPQLANGAGIAGAIFARAGVAQLQAACQALPVDPDGIRCHPGDARITFSFGLQAQGVTHIIHAVGPNCRLVTNTIRRKELITTAYQNALRRADENNIASVSIPFLSSGIYAPDPRDEPDFKEFAARTAIEAVLEFMEHAPTTVRTVSFVLINQDDFNLFSNLMASYSPDTVRLSLSYGQGKPQWNRLIVGATLGTVIFGGLLWALTRKKKNQQPTAAPNQ